MEAIAATASTVMIPFQSNLVISSPVISDTRKLWCLGVSEFSGTVYTKPGVWTGLWTGLWTQQWTCHLDYNFHQGSEVTPYYSAAKFWRYLMLWSHLYAQR